jgi:uncharacterized Zn finger protein (UPF0148 family)
MECAIHPGVEAVSFCSNCGTPLCQGCQWISDSRILCPKCQQSFASQIEHVQNSAVSVANSTVSTREAVRHANSGRDPQIEQGYPYCSPGVSLALGFIPGVGAICNGEYWKALLQILIFSSLISLARATESEEVTSVLRLLAVSMYLYMPVEAYHVARKRIMALRGVNFVTPFEKMRFSSLAVGSGAVCLGVILQVSQFVPETMRFLLRGWPLILVGIGVYNLTRYFRSK